MGLDYGQRRATGTTALDPTCSPRKDGTPMTSTQQRDLSELILGRKVKAGSAGPLSSPRCGVVRLLASSRHRRDHAGRKPGRRRASRTAESAPTRTRYPATAIASPAALGCTSPT